MTTLGGTYLATEPEQVTVPEPPGEDSPDEPLAPEFLEPDEGLGDEA